MIGLSKKDKEEILEFPKTFGVILHGMHQDLTVIHASLDEYKDILNKYIRYSKSLKDKIDLEVVNIRQEREKTFKELQSINVMFNSLDALKLGIETQYKEISIKSENIDNKLNESNRLYDYKLLNLSSNVESFNNRLETEEQKINVLELNIGRYRKEMLILKVAIIVIAILCLISLIIHFI